MAASSVMSRSEIFPVTGSWCSASNFWIAATVGSSSAPLRRIRPSPSSNNTHCTAIMRGDPADEVEDGVTAAPIRVPIGSLRCAAGTWVFADGATRAGASAARSGTLVDAGLTDGAFGAAGPGAGALGAAERLLTAGGNAAGLAKNGAGCMPDCRKMALTTMIRLAAPTHKIAAASTGRWAAVLHRRSPTAASAAVAIPLPARRLLLVRRSGTLLHRHAFRLAHHDRVCRASGAFLWRLTRNLGHRRQLPSCGHG